MRICFIDDRNATNFTLSSNRSHFQVTLHIIYPRETGVIHNYWNSGGESFSLTVNFQSKRRQVLSFSTRQFDEGASNAGNRTDDRTFKQDPRGVCIIHTASLPRRRFRPLAASSRDAILACRCQFVPLPLSLTPSTVFLSSVFLSFPLSFHLPKMLFLQDPRHIRLPNYWKQQQETKRSFPFSLTHTRANTSSSSRLSFSL